MNSSDGTFCTNSSSGFDFPDLDMFDADDEFPIHETFSFEGGAEQQGRQQIVEEAKFFWAANNHGGSSSSSSSSSSFRDGNVQSQQPMQHFFQSTIQSAQ
tara:strand:- start:252 stop:551 length:300 start_codon:yes stop_codon:yes gene_type:complete